MYSLPPRTNFYDVIKAQITMTTYRYMKGNRYFNTAQILCRYTKNALKSLDAASGTTRLSKDSSSDQGDSILNILSVDHNNKNVGKSIENAVQAQVKELERINLKHDRNVVRLANKLTYIQNAIGLSTEGNHSNHTNHNDQSTQNRILANELIDMPIDKVIELVKSLAANNSSRYNTPYNNSKVESELSILLSHLVFRNALTCDLFSKIIMKFGLFNLRKIHDKLKLDPEGFIKGWNVNSRSRIVCGLALAARYKMLKDYNNAKFILLDEFKTVWMNTLVNNIDILNGSDLKNIINVTDGLIEYGYLVVNAIKVNNGNFIYSFWENHSDDGIIKEWLENEISVKDEKLAKLNKFQKFVIEAYLNPCISTNKKFKQKVLNISKKLQLSIISSEKVNRNKFFIFNELLINEIEEEEHGNEEMEAYINTLKKQFHQLRNDINKNATTVGNDINICDNFIKTSNI